MRNLLTKKLLLMSFGFVRRIAGYPVKLLKSLGKPLKQYKIYGNSIQQCKNFLYTDKATQTLNGVTLTNENGVITLNGTCTTSSNFELGELVLYPGVYTLSTNATVIPVENSYALLQVYDSTNNKNIVVNNKYALKPTINSVSVKGTFAYRIRIDKDCVYDNFVMKPQLELGTISTDFEPHYKPSPTTPIEIQSVGERTKNLFYIPDITGTTPSTTIQCNITKPFTVSCQEYPSLIANNNGVETSIWRFQIKYLDGTLTYIVDNTLKGVIDYGSTIKATEENPVVKITYRGIYIREGKYSKFLVEYGNAITEYEPYGYKIPIKVTGKNLFDISKTDTNMISKGYIEIANNGYNILKTENFTNGSAIGNFSEFVPDLKVGDKFKITFETNAIRNNQNVNYIYLNVYKGVLKIGIEYIATQEMLDSKMYIYSGGTENCYYKNIMIYISKYTDEFEPYTEPVVNNIYLDEPLRRVGEYADYIDFKKGKVIRNIYEIRLLSSKTYLLGGYTDIFYTNLGSRTINSYRAGMITHGIVSPTKYTSELTKNEAMISPSAKNIYYKNNNFTLETYKEYLNSHIINCCYVFATPTEETIDLPEIQTVKNTAIITTDTSIPAWCISCEYLSKTKDNNTAYLKSSKAQYIDIEFKPNQDTAVEAKCLSTSTDTQFLWGARDSNLKNTFTTLFSTSNHARFDYNETAGSYVNFAPTLNKTYVYYQNKNKGIIDNILFKTWTYADFQSNYNLHLFTVNQANLGNPNKLIGNIYYCKVWDNDILIRDMIPVTDYQGTPSMWDFETEKYYYNKGTGTDFIFGNEEE